MSPPSGLASTLVSGKSGLVVIVKRFAYTSAKGLEESASALEKATGSKCLATPADVRDPAAIKIAVEATLAKFGRIDFVICGAAGNL